MSTPALASGYTVTFAAAGGGSFSPSLLTRVTLNQTGSANRRQRVSIAHLNEPYTMTKTVGGVSQTVQREEPFVEIWQPRGGGGGTLDLEFIGSHGLVAAGVSGTLTVSGGGLQYSNGNVTCTSSQLTLSVGDVVRGSASFALPASPPAGSCNC